MSIQYMLDNNEKIIMAHKARAKQMHNKRSTQEMSSIQSRFILFWCLAVIGLLIYSSKKLKEI